MKVHGISFLKILPKIVSPPAWACCAFWTSSLEAILRVDGFKPGNKNWRLLLIKILEIFLIIVKTNLTRKGIASFNETFCDSQRSLKYFCEKFLLINFLQNVEDVQSLAEKCHHQAHCSPLNDTLPYWRCHVRVERGTIGCKLFLWIAFSLSFLSMTFIFSFLFSYVRLFSTLHKKNWLLLLTKLTKTTSSRNYEAFGRSVAILDCSESQPHLSSEGQEDLTSTTQLLMKNFQGHQVRSRCHMELTRIFASIKLTGTELKNRSRNIFRSCK